MFIVLAVIGGVVFYCLYRYIKSNFPLTYEDLEDEGIKPFQTWSPIVFWFILFSHWRYKNIKLSILCILSCLIVALLFATMWQWEVICTPPFKLD
jgi:hypothetical protein